jgi:glycosyltransferase involved in cell wall biosynthesis
MRILITHLYDARYKLGGAERVVLNLATSFQRDFGHDVCVAINEGDLQELLKKQGIRTQCIPYSKSKAVQLLTQLHSTIKSFKPDVIHSHHRYTTFISNLFFKNKNIIVHTEHVLRQNKRFLFRWGHAAIGVHLSVSHNLVKHYRAPENLVTTIPNAIPFVKPDAFKLSQLRASYPRHKGERFVLFAGRLEEQKGHAYLIEAVAKMPETVRDRIRIFLAGEGSLKDSLQTKVKTLSLENQFIFLGQTQDIPEWLSLCDFALLPSLWEGLPLSLLEAYSAAKPVIASDIDGIKDIVVSGQTGILVPPRDVEALSKALLHFMEQPVEVFSMGREAHNLWQERFSFEKMIESHLELYQKLIREYGKKR